jgi:predicted membrane-bound spermidine synthase
MSTDRLMVTTLLPAIFFLSGCAALIFENLWFYQAGITFGNSVWASSLVLAGFMGGLALGNGLAARLRSGRFRAIRMYAMLELAIGVSGFALVVGLPALTSLLAGLMEPLLSSAWLVNPVRLGFAFLLLLVPSTAMGATLPVMVSAVYRQDPRFGSVLGRLYGWNTLGAVVGALAGDLVLIEAFGVRGTGLAAAAIGLTAAGLAFVLSQRFEGEEAAVASEPEAPRERLSARARWLLGAAAIAGFTLLGLEVVWFRFLLHFMFGSSKTFAILLATVLAGIGLGGLIGGAIAASEDRAQQALPGAAMVTGILCLALYWLYPSAPPDYAAGAAFSGALSLMFPIAFLSGVLFTLLGAALKSEMPSETRAAGLLTLANTTGATLGPLLIGFVLLPAFGIDRCVQVLSSLYLLMSLVLLAAGLRPKQVANRAFVGVAGASLAVMLVAFPVGGTLERHLRPVVEQFMGGEETEPVAMREGVVETIIYMEERVFGEPVSYRMVTNGYSMSGTDITALRYMKLFVYLPMALNPDAKNALLISYGVGSTAKALTNTAGLESIDVVDISRDVLEMNEIVYPEEGELPLDDPRVEVHVEDGRYFLETTKKRFDLITGEPPPPKMAGVVTLYTREYFSLVRERLAEGGIVSYWLPAHVLSPDDSKSIIAAFCDVFEDCTLWNGAGLDWILLGTRNATGPGSVGAMAQQWSDPVIGPDLQLLAVESPAQLGALFMAGPEDLDEIAGDAPPLTDDYPKRLADQPFDLAAGLSTYVPWLDKEDTRRRFERSPWIERMWPKELRDATPSYFAEQWEINRLLIEGPGLDPEVVLPKLHVLLTDTQLRTLPLWMLRSDEPRQQAAAAAFEKDKTNASALGELGLGALARREYALALRLFVGAVRGGASGPQIQNLAVYAQFMATPPEGRPAMVQGLKDAGSASTLQPWVIPFLEQLMRAQ